MSDKNLLVEIFVEELPPKALKKLGESFAQLLADSLKAQGLTGSDNKVTAYASPRRLAVHVMQVLAQAADKTITQKLMPVSVGLDVNGNATPALIKRLNGMGLDETAVARLSKQADGKNEALFLDVTQKGVALKDGLQIALTEAITKLPIPKVMTYQLADGWQSVNFVRPVHGLLALHGNEIIPVTALGLTASNSTQGHRFEASISPVVINHADSYAEQLKNEGAVIASFADRRAEIERQLNVAAAKQNLKPIEDDALLDEVTALVERPNVLLGQFEEIYLEVPQECLILTMKANQKYFPLLDVNSKLTNKFLIVSNISPADPSAVIGGNERVVRPRLADAKFFFDQDRKKTLESRLEGLNKVVYHNKLGSQGDKVQAVKNLIDMIVVNYSVAKYDIGFAGSDELKAKDSELHQVWESARKAAELAKADLLTDMVGEFPELQGIMGRYYALHEGLSNDIAYAIEEHYMPRFAGDQLPQSIVGTILALADKLVTICGLFGIGEKPTGDKDPFGLRRQALGVTRLLIESELKVNFQDLISSCVKNMWFTKKSFSENDEITSSIISFIEDRLSYSLVENGYSTNEVEAVISLHPNYLQNIPKQLLAVRSFQTLEEAPALAAANKRVGNILKKVEGEVKAEVNANLLTESAEIALNEALSKAKPEADKLFESGDYTASLKSLAALKAPVDAFFDNVMVNADDPALKANRLGLLATLHQTMNRVADLSKLAS